MGHAVGEWWEGKLVSAGGRQAINSGLNRFSGRLHLALFCRRKLARSGKNANTDS